MTVPAGREQAGPVVRVACGGTSYAWVDIAPPPDGSRGRGWAHHDVAVTSDGRLVVFEPGGSRVAVLDAGGDVVATWPSGMVEAHGMAIRRDPAGEDELWIADPGKKAVPGAGGGYEDHVAGDHGTVAAFDLAGRRRRELPVPAVEAYAEGHYRPTAVAIDERGDGSVWVADGYGESLVHKFSAAGELRLTLTGEEGAGRFDCPHSLFVDCRQGRSRLYVADRGNGRLQKFTLDGAFLGVVTGGLLAPSAIAVHGQEMYVADLRSRVAVLDADDQLVCHLGRDDDAHRRAGWPNELGPGDAVVRPGGLAAGRFNSPHGIAVDGAGDLYVAEWLVGGRITRLARER